jgi:hypothetical protein
VTRRWLALAMLAACESGPPPAHPQVAMLGPGVLVPGPPLVGVEPQRLNQPPEIKLKLGHYRNDELNIGAVVDLTRDDVRLRFDGSDEVMHLLAEPGQHGRTDYMINGSRVVMQTWTGGRVVVYVNGSDEPIGLYRDGDAEPL